MEIYQLMEEFGDSLLEKNIRRYLGRNIINDGIADTLLDEGKRQNFFFFNNGVTMICQKFVYNGLQERDWIIKINGLQIINGGQTCMTIHQTVKEHPEIDFSQAYVLVRIYEVDDTEERGIIQDITYATNSQNPVDFRDLKLNDERQMIMAVLIFRYCDSCRKRSSSNKGKLEDIHGRTMAAAFRRFDIIEYYLKNEEWWKRYM